MGQIWEVPRLQPTCNRTQIAAQGLEQATARGRPGSACVGQGPGPGATREGGRVRASDATPRSPPWRVLVLSCPCFDSASPAPHLDTDLGPCTASQVRQICFPPFGTHPRLHRRQCPDGTASEFQILQQPPSATVVSLPPTHPIMAVRGYFLPANLEGISNADGPRCHPWCWSLQNTQCGGGASTRVNVIEIHADQAATFISMQPLQPEASGSARPQQGGRHGFDGTRLRKSCLFFPALSVFSGLPSSHHSHLNQHALPSMIPPPSQPPDGEVYLGRMMRWNLGQADILEGVLATGRCVTSATAGMFRTLICGGPLESDIMDPSASRSRRVDLPQDPSLLCYPYSSSCACRSLRVSFSLCLPQP
jgi:hypothetical protein